MAKLGGVPNVGRSRLFLTMLVLALFLLSGCSKLRQLAQQPKIIKKQQQEITGLKSKINSLEIELAGVQQGLKAQHTNMEQKFTTYNSSLNVLGTKYAELDSEVNKHKKCVFQKNSKGVQRLDTDMVPLLVSLGGITAHNDRYRLSLNIGNPSMSEISQFTLHLNYGKAFKPSGSESYANWLKSLKSITKRFKETLKPGRWNKIDVSLGKLRPDEVGYITVEMRVDNIILKKNRPSDTRNISTP